MAPPTMPDCQGTASGLLAGVPFDTERVNVNAVPGAGSCPGLVNGLGAASDSLLFHPVVGGS